MSFVRLMLSSASKAFRFDIKSSTVTMFCGMDCFLEPSDPSLCALSIASDNIV